MGRIQVPRIYEPLELGDYADELADIRIMVWVNPPRSVKQEYFRISRQVQLASPRRRASDPKSAGSASTVSGWLFQLWQRLAQPILRRVRRRKSTMVDRAVVAWYANVWSEDGVRQPMGANSVVDFAEQLVEQDPALWAWLCARTWKMIGEFLDAAKKA